VLITDKEPCKFAVNKDKIQIIRFYLSLACQEIINRWQFSFSKGEKWFDKLFNVKYLPLFHHFKATYQFQKHNFLVKIVAIAPLTQFYFPFLFIVFICLITFSLNLITTYTKEICNKSYIILQLMGK
jgi:hypothetical protein